MGIFSPELWQAIDLKSNLTESHNWEASWACLFFVGEGGDALSECILDLGENW